MANRRTQKSGEVNSVTQSSDIFAGSTLATADLKPFQILAADGRPVREELIPDLEIV